MRGSGLAWVALVGAALFAPGCKCINDCIFGSSDTPPPSTPHQGVVVICRQDDPNKAIAFVSFDKNDAFHTWWLVRAGEQVLPIQAILAGMPAAPHETLTWMPVSDLYTPPADLCVPSYRNQLTDPLGPPVMVDVHETQNLLQCQ
jgi:hypothetical protein